MKNIIPYYIEQKYKQGQKHGFLTAYTMFIDLSGFTPITEALMKQGSSGAEKLSDILNEIFEPLVALVYARGGFIPYFAGDAFTAIFPEDTTEDAVELLQTALLTCQLFSHRKFEFEQFSIGIKVGLSFGEVEWGITGKERHSFYFQGKAIDNCANGQNEAVDQEIIIDDTLRALLEHSSYSFTAIKPPFHKFQQDGFAVKNKLAAAKRNVSSKEVALSFYPQSVVDYQEEGEFRTVVSVFIAFTGIDSHEELDAFSTIVLAQAHNFSGYFKEIDFSDKGGVMVIFFGAPISFENNDERALEFILAVREEVTILQQRNALKIKAGITLGTAYTGIVGGVERSQYACVGNYINFSARLMSGGDWGEVLVDKEIQHNRLFIFSHKGDIKYKGFQSDMPTYKLLGHSIEDWPTYNSNFIGREVEFSQLLALAKPVFEENKGSIGYVFGEAGIGKSRLMYELRNALITNAKISWHACQSDQILRKPFNPFIYFLKNYFDQSPDASVADKKGSFESRLAQLKEDLGKNTAPRSQYHRRELERTQSILAALLGVYYPNSLWEQLDAKGRYQNTIAAIVNLFIAESICHPIVIEIEDAHWTDEESKEVLLELIKKSKNSPILLMITSRFNDDGSTSFLLNKENAAVYQMPFVELQLKSLSESAVQVFAETLLGGNIKFEFLKLLLRTSNNNPFYLEQILEYFTESNLLKQDNGEWTIKDENIKLSNSINAILTARIDRLSALVKETVKAAAVIGREFEVPVLSEVMRVQDAFVRENGDSGFVLNQQIKSAERVQIWRAMNELRYIFRHSLLREAVYGMQLHTRLQQLHKLIAEAIERLHKNEIEDRYPDLAFHYEQAEVHDKASEYLHKAGDWARSNYQNRQALGYYQRLIRLLAEKEDNALLAKVYMKAGKILQAIGQWDESQSAYDKALNLAKKEQMSSLLGRVLNNIGRLFTLKGDYATAMKELQVAAGIFENKKDQIGIAKVYGNIGDLNFRQGNYEEAKAYFEQSISINHVLDSTSGMARIVSNLGLTHMNQGNYDEGIKVQLRQLKISQEKGDKPGMTILYVNTGIVYLEKGDYDAALDPFKKGLALSEELGNKLLTSIAVGCIGAVYQGKGDYKKAMELFEEDLKLCEELGDKQGIAIALGLIGELLSVEGEFHKAIEYLQKNLMLCDQLGYQKGIAKAVNTLGDIFYFLKQYERSLHFYNRAIEVTRKINNKLVLGYSLVEKGAVLLAMNRMDELVETNKEALEITEKLGNPDLYFESKLLAFRVLHSQGKLAEAKGVLLALLEKNKEKQHQAATYFELALLEPSHETHRKNALALYTSLFAVTPRFIYKDRIAVLKSI